MQLRIEASDRLPPRCLADPRESRFIERVRFAKVVALEYISPYEAVSPATFRIQSYSSPESRVSVAIAPRGPAFAVLNRS